MAMLKQNNFILWKSGRHIVKNSNNSFKIIKYKEEIDNSKSFQRCWVIAGEYLAIIYLFLYTHRRIETQTHL